MTLQKPENQRGPSPFKSPLYLFGFMIVVGGATLVGISITRQLTNPMEGRDFYDWMAVGVALFVFGIGLMGYSTRRQPRE